MNTTYQDEMEKQVLSRITKLPTKGNYSVISNTLEKMEYELSQIDPVHYKPLADKIREIIFLTREAIEDIKLNS